MQTARRSGAPDSAVMEILIAQSAVSASAQFIDMVFSMNWVPGRGRSRN